MASVVLGSQWGDEGKGKLVDILAHDQQFCVRFNGGSNAGHTLEVNGVKLATHLLPSGVFNKDCVNVIANGVVLHLPTLFKELGKLDELKIDYKDRIKISYRTHLVFDFHQVIDGMNEKGLGAKSLGTTKRGIGPTYAEKCNRSGLRVCDLVADDFEEFAKKLRNLFNKTNAKFKINDGEEATYDIEAEIARYAEMAPKVREFACDTIQLLNNAIADKKSVLFEGANAALLDLDYGTYPFVTSSNPTIGGVLTGAGVSHKALGAVYGVVKAYTTRVGAGPFPSELAADSSEHIHLQTVGHEFGTTTGRPRRCGWFDAVIVRYTALINGYDAVNLTKLDVLTNMKKLRILVNYARNGTKLGASEFPAIAEGLEYEYEELQGWTEDISKCKKWEELPEAARKYVTRIEELAGVKVRWIGVGAGRLDMIDRGL